MDVFQYLPNLKYEASIGFSIPLSVNTSDHKQEQRYSNATVRVITYGSSRVYYDFDTVRSYEATYTALGLLHDSIIVNRLHSLRGAAIYLPFFMEPLQATADLAGLSSFQLSNVETPYSELKFLSTSIIRLSRLDRDFFELRTMTNDFQTALNSGNLTVSAPWTASIDPDSCVLFFADTVYPSGPMTVNQDTSKVHNVRVAFESV